MRYHYLVDQSDLLADAAAHKRGELSLAPVPPLDEPPPAEGSGL
jgi:hypothetical protein